MYHHGCLGLLLWSISSLASVILIFVDSLTGDPVDVLGMVIRFYATVLRRSRTDFKSTGSMTLHVSSSQIAFEPLFSGVIGIEYLEMMVFRLLFRGSEACPLVSANDVNCRNSSCCVAFRPTGDLCHDHPCHNTGLILGKNLPSLMPLMLDNHSVAS